MTFPRWAILGPVLVVAGMAALVYGLAIRPGQMAARCDDLRMEVLLRESGAVVGDPLPAENVRWYREHCH